MSIRAPFIYLTQDRRQFFQAFAAVFKYVPAGEVPPGHGAAVAVSGNDRRVIHPVQAARHVADGVEAGDGVLVRVQDPETRVGQKTAGDGQDRGSEFRRIKRRFFAIGNSSSARFPNSASSFLSTAALYRPTTAASFAGSIPIFPASASMVSAFTTRPFSKSLLDELLLPVRDERVPVHAEGIVVEQPAGKRHAGDHLRLPVGVEDRCTRNRRVPAA